MTTTSPASATSSVTGRLWYPAMAIAEQVRRQSVNRPGDKGKPNNGGKRCEIGRLRREDSGRRWATAALMGGSVTGFRWLGMIRGWFSLCSME
ncbi:hypothetical protein RHMOL_Rhmol08G0201300 [Rhododendron molle]|uniref:Uncharacterized protein n=1 Tax=Rhododendron molle TaxID=49168 RepID=A0ACC0MQE7_RHOML|nr:hypothetical protein RHMOL_Rhmol08G0201300 [Rhododendron molle]